MAYGGFNAGTGKAPDEDVLRTDQLGAPGGAATLDADGKLSESQRPEVDAYTKAQTEERISAAVADHNVSYTAHSDIRATNAKLRAEIDLLKLKYDTSISKNPFTVTFDSLDGAIVTGVWNDTLARVEF